MKERIWDITPKILRKMPVPGALLVTSNEKEKNVMLIGWLQLGFVWNKPVINIMVRPSRYSYSFLQENGDFTVNIMPNGWDDALKICGSKSGRDLDKFKEAGLEVFPSEKVSSFSLKEAEITLEGRTLYKDEMKSEFLEKSLIDGYYPKGDLHQIITAEILNLKVKL